ncbi:uncharacterized protein LOC143299845 isoform X2 [Babylonia areolata]|uniref:uncharacterized protein LOC143299845 isoform X2 n=1 Tax=Babylonia areolata TaxID=304850 RepID=UPI003FD6BEDC
MNIPRNAILWTSFLVVIVIIAPALLVLSQSALRVWTVSTRGLPCDCQCRGYRGSTDFKEDARTSREVNVTVTSLAEGTARPEVVLFSTWVSRPYKRVIHDNVLGMWPLISPASFTCLLFSDEEEERHRAKSFGWHTPPLPRTSCGGIPIFREMFFTTMTTMPTARIFGFVNGDLLLGATLRDTLQAVLDRPELMAKPLLLLLRRLNVPFHVEFRVTDFRKVEELKLRGKPLLDGSSDAFFTNRWFPWRLVPDIVPGRIGIGMWLVAAARALNVTVIDLTDTVTTLHMTSSAGNVESHKHDNAMCNRELYNHLGVKPSSWACGFINCAHLQSRFANNSGNASHVHIQSKAPTTLPDHCKKCFFNTNKLKELSTNKSSDSRK